MFQFQEEINGELGGGGGVAAVKKQLLGGIKNKKFSWGSEGSGCSHYGGFTEVLSGSLMPEQADDNRNPLSQS